MNQYNAKKITRNNTLQLNENVLTQLIGKMDEMFISMQNLMSSVAYNPVVYAYYKEEEKRPLMQDDLKDVLINTLITDDYISGIELYNMEGNKLLGVGKNIHRQCHQKILTLLYIPNKFCLMMEIM